MTNLATSDSVTDAAPVPPTNAPFQPPRTTDLYAHLAERLLPVFLTALEAAGPQHRLRVTTLPGEVADRLCQSLQGDERWVARTLAPATVQVEPWKATATKVIELRNALECPLLVLIPPGLRTAAEDSLDIATFSELPLSSASADLAASLLERVPEPLRSAIAAELAFLRSERQVGSGTDAEVEYLLGVTMNGSTPEAAGAAIHALELLPDRALFTRGQTRLWLTRNQRFCEILGDADQPLQSRIAKLRVRRDTTGRELFSFLLGRRTQALASWARDIAARPELAALDLARWEFQDDPTADQLRIVLDPLGLPLQTADEVSGAVRMRILNLNGGEPLKVVFRTAPAPSDHPAWRTFRIQLLQVEGTGSPVVTWESNNYPKPKTRPPIRRSIKPSDLAGLGEGTYFVRVDAYDESGAVITTLRRVDEAVASSRAENESEPFLLVSEDAAVEEPDTRSVPVASLQEAWTLASARPLVFGPRARAASTAGSIGSRGKSATGSPSAIDLATVTGEWTEPPGALARGDSLFQLTGGLSGFSVAVPALLRRLEAEILRHPRDTRPRSIDFGKARTASEVEVGVRPGAPGLAEVSGDRPETAAFLGARAMLFAAILGLEPSSAAASAGLESASIYPSASLTERVVETADLPRYGEHIEAYARAYVDLVDGLLQGTRASSGATVLRTLAALDHVEVRWQATATDPGRALLLAPTHPVRILWHLAHAKLSRRCVLDLLSGASAASSPRAFVDQLRRSLLPTNLPLALFDRRGQGYIEHAPLTPFWSLYLPDRTQIGGPVDVMAARDRLLPVLGGMGAGSAVPLVDGEGIAEQLFQFVCQHPYVGQLRLNVFNPGCGSLLADVLRAVERRRLSLGRDRAPELRYEVHLFAAGEHDASADDGLEGLLDPARQVGDDDEFSLAPRNHLRPKLVFARHQLGEFLQDPGRYNAHVSILLDHFSANARVGRVGEFRRGVFLDGLVSEPDVRLEEGGPHFAWVRGVGPNVPGGPPTTADGATKVSSLLGAVAAATQRAQASAAVGEARDPDVGTVVAFRLGAEDLALLAQVHEVSDWVLTVDRHLGLEYFDGPSTEGATGYLLDFAPDFLREDRRRLLLTTRSATEVKGLIRPMLERYALLVADGPGADVFVLETLRSLSGRLALRVDSGPSKGAETVGLLFARWLLEREGLLAGRIAIPLDAHREWFTGGEATDLATGPGPGALPTSARRADLLLVAIGDDGAVRMDVVEIKLREELSDAGRAELYDGMREQTENTVRRLRELFDPEAFALPRADGTLRTRELAGLLSFYARRAERYGLLAPADAKMFLDRAELIADGYRLDVRMLGILVENKGAGLHADEDTTGFRVLRLGGDRARSLFAERMSRFGARASRSDETGSEDEPADDTATASPSGAPGGLHVRAARAQQDDRPALDLLRDALIYPDAGLRTRFAPRSSVDAASSGTEPAEVTPSRDPEARQASRPNEVEPSAASSDQEPAPWADVDPQTRLGKRSTGGAGEKSEVDADLIGAARGERAEADDGALPQVDVFLGSAQPTPQYGLIGRSGTAKVALDLNGCNTISLFGVQGFGKSYTLGAIAEMATTSVSQVNRLPAPLATVIFHYHKSEAYEPEHVTALEPNRNVGEVERLLREYEARPQGLVDVLLLAPEDKVERRRREYPGLTVEPIKFAAAELGSEGWRFLMGAHGNEALYVRQLVAIMRRHRDGLSLDVLRREIEAADLSKSARKLAEDRLSLAAAYIDDGRRLGTLLRPGRTIVVDLRDEWIEQDEALGIFVVMLRIFAAQRSDGREFNKLVVFDEAHKYITDSELVSQVVETIREMRHQATSVLIASQDPLSVPRAIVELTSVLVLHRITSPQWLKHLRGAISALDGMPDAAVTALAPGEALVWAQRASDQRFTQRPQKVKVRPRFSQHGGGTKVAFEP